MRHTNKILSFVLLSFMFVYFVHALHHAEGTAELESKPVFETDAIEASSHALYLFAGGYPTENGIGIYVYKFDEETGESTFVSEAEAVNATYLTVSSDNRYVYSVSETRNDATVNAFSFDKKEGKLKLLNTQPTNSALPLYISIDQAGHFVVTANYAGGTVSVFPLASDGLLQPAVKTFEFEGTGLYADRQQDKSHPHSVVFSPDRQYLFAADLGTDKIHKFTVNSVAPFLTIGNPVSYATEPGSGPRHLTFHPNGKYAYLINELSGKVTVFRYADGQLETIQYIAADTSDGVGGKGSADVHVTPDGKFLYASNRARTNNIAIFRINDANGQLTFVGHQPTGRHPRGFIITPNGKYLLVANTDSHQIQVFTINSETGQLNEDPSKLISINRPVCLKLIAID